MTQSRREFVRGISIGAGALAVGATTPLAAKAKRPPNVVYFMVDEMAYYELSFMGHPNHQTPNLDKMAAEGVWFTQALAGAPVCAPTRCTLMTGKHLGHSSVRANDGGTPMREGEETVASILKDIGYATGGFGKWGCGGRGSTGVPEKHGFDVFLGYYDQVHAHTFFPPYILRNSEEVPLEGNKGGATGPTYSHYKIIDGAMDFIRENKDNPFFCYMCVTPPHGMHSIPDDDPAWRIFKDKDWPEGPRRYAAMVNMIDRQIGDVIALLKKLGLDDNTIVFFCGDNGGQDIFRDKDHPRGFHGQNVDPKTGKGFRATKGNLYEGGLRIPMIARWPGKIEPGRKSDHLWYFPDVLPTVAEITGANAPKDIDGISIIPELIGAKPAGRKQEKHEYLYWEYRTQTAVRMGDWKLIRTKADRDWELYDLSKDIEEKVDIADEHPDILAKMKGYAAEAHEECVPGTFADRTLHERDRAQKFGGKATKTSKPKGKAAKNSLPTEGLVPVEETKLVRFSSEATNNQRFAKHAIDGDPTTVWHSAFKPKVLQHPHELVIDLGRERNVTGLRYLARQDKGWNGAIKDCEVFLSNGPDNFDGAATKMTFKKAKSPQENAIKPTKGRYLLLRTLSSHGGPWASAADIGVVAD